MIAHTKHIATLDDVAGIFRLSLLDDGGASFLDGFLSLTQGDARIHGSWDLSDGRSGSLIGICSDCQISLDLDQDSTSDSLILQGQLVGAVYYGQWFQLGYAGVLASGQFVATRT